MAKAPAFVKAANGLDARAMAKDDPERAKRLAAQLRANLKRRKAQARGAATPSPDAAPVSPPEDA